ncbi:MAG: UPF0182 family membrane protein [Jatrophihabitantaceae bacterium]
MRPPIPSLSLSRRSKIALSALGILVVVLIVAVKLTSVYVNLLWFDSVGYRGVYRDILWTRIILFLIFGVAMALVIGGNLVIAYVLRPPFRPMSAEQQNLERYRVMIEPKRKVVLGVIAGISLLAAGMSAQGNWGTWLLWLHGGSFGVTDPQFHRDISFFAWDYPAYRLMLGFGFTAVLFSLVLSLGVHYLSGAIRLQTPGPKVTPSARRHLTILVFVFMALKAVAYWLDRYGLVFSDRSKFTGASYTDVHAVLASKTILFWIAVILALGVLASLWLRSALLPGIGFIVLMVLSVLISGIYPAIIQQVSVKPNASSKEAPYIRRNIQATRDAYGIQTGTNVVYQPYTAVSQPSTAALAQTNPTIANIRILDPNVISPTFSKFQQDGNVYGFPAKLDVDRYKIGGITHDYIVAVRELDKNNLTGNQSNWINQHTNYTHGYGFVAAQADSDITSNGNQPGAFTEGGIPPIGQLTLKNPAAYYGELLPDYSIVGANGVKQEFDAGGKTKVSYQGGGGVPLDSLLNRLAFAVNYRQTNFLLNDAASASGAKIIFNRDPRQMLGKVAPFLKVDSDPYPIVDQSSGDIVWMVDGYTTMNDYPYSEQQSLSSLTNDSLSANNRTASQPNDTINYIRNSVKATIDAYTGKVTLYQWDAKDPVLKAWMRIFPGLVHPVTDMPKSVLEHVRYPEDLFEVQRATLGLYHIDDPVTFYNVGDKWTVPNDPNDTAADQPPYYVLASPPSGGSSPTFQLTSPMDVNNSTYLAAYLSVDGNPGPDYGKITALQLPRGSSAVQGPEQIFNVLNGNANITKDLSLFNQAGGGSSVIHGNLLTLPVGKSFLYVEPLYIQGSGGGSGTYPILQRVIVVYGDRIGYGATLADSLSDLLPGHKTGQTLPGFTDTSTSPVNGGSTSSAPPSSPPVTSSAPGSSSAPGTHTTAPAPPVTPSQQALLAQLNVAFADLLAANKSGDFAKAGAAQAKVNELVQQYLAKYGSLPGASSPAPSK